METGQQNNVKVFNEWLAILELPFNVIHAEYVRRTEIARKVSNNLYYKTAKLEDGSRKVSHQRERVTDLLLIALPKLEERADKLMPLHDKYQRQIEDLREDISNAMRYVSPENSKYWQEEMPREYWKHDRENTLGKYWDQIDFEDSRQQSHTGHKGNQCYRLKMRSSQIGVQQLEGKLLDAKAKYVQCLIERHWLDVKKDKAERLKNKLLYMKEPTGIYLDDNRRWRNKEGKRISAKSAHAQIAKALRAQVWYSRIYTLLYLHIADRSEIVNYRLREWRQEVEYKLKSIERNKDYHIPSTSGPNLQAVEQYRLQRQNDRHMQYRFERMVAAHSNDHDTWCWGITGH